MYDTFGSFLTRFFALLKANEEKEIQINKICIVSDGKQLPY